MSVTVQINNKKRCSACFSEVTVGSCFCGYNGFYNNPDVPINSILMERYIIGKAQTGGEFGLTYLAYDSIGDCKVSLKASDIEANKQHLAPPLQSSQHEQPEQSQQSEQSRQNDSRESFSERERNKSRNRPDSTNRNSNRNSSSSGKKSEPRNQERSDEQRKKPRKQNEPCERRGSRFGQPEERVYHEKRSSVGAIVTALVIFLLLLIAAGAIVFYHYGDDIIAYFSGDSGDGTANEIYETDEERHKAMLSEFVRDIRELVLTEDFEAVKTYMTQANIENSYIDDFVGLFGYFEVYDGEMFGGSELGADWRSDYGPTEKEWYTIAVKANGRIALTEPYAFSNGATTYMRTYSQAIYDEFDNLLAVIGLEVDITQFVKSGEVTVPATSTNGTIDPPFTTSGEVDPSLTTSGMADPSPTTSGTNLFPTTTSLPTDTAPPPAHDDTTMEDDEEDNNDE